MSKQEAIKIVEDMPEDKFQEFFNNLPMRTQLCVKGGLVDWRECLANWYIKLNFSLKEKEYTTFCSYAKEKYNHLKKV